MFESIYMEGYTTAGLLNQEDKFKIISKILLVIVSITTLYEAIIVLFEESESSLIICGWNKIANNAPKSVPIVSAFIGGVFFTIIINTIIGIINSIKEILKVFSIVSIKNELSVTPLDVW